MPYNLFFTRADGQFVKTLRSPYDTRQDTERTVRVLVDDGIRQVGALAFADQVATAPLGVPVTDPTSGITFRTEEA